MTIGLLRTQILRLQNVIIFFFFFKKNPRDIKLLKKLPPLYVAPRVNVLYIRTHHWTLYWDRSFWSSLDINLTPVSKLSFHRCKVWPRAVLQIFLLKHARFSPPNAQFMFCLRYYIWYITLPLPDAEYQLQSPSL